MIFSITSCNKDDISENRNKNLVNLNNPTIKDGRLNFNSKQNFQDVYNKLSDLNETELANHLSNFYEEDFQSLRPVFNDETEKFADNRILRQKSITRILKAKSCISCIQKLSDSEIDQNISENEKEDITEDIDFTENVIADETFASLLNENGEISVNDSIYKYTDVGMFATHKNKINKLYEYLNQKNISLNLAIETERNIKESFLVQNKIDGLRNINSDIVYFSEKTVPENTSNNQTEEKKSNIESFGFKNLATSQDLNNIANNLPIGEISQPFLSNLFGQVKITEDRYEKRRRVKLKYYNQNYFLAYVVGIKVDHEYRGWTGFWRNEKTNQVVLGLNSMSWRFDEPYFITNPNPNPLPTTYYLSDGKAFSTLKDYYNNKYMGKVPLPNLPFKKQVDVIIEFASHTTGYDGMTEDQLKKIVWKELYGQAESLLRTQNNKQLTKLGVVYKGRSYTWIQYYDFSTGCSNCSVQDRLIDWGIATPQVTYTFGSGLLDGNTSITSWTMDFRRPSVVTVNAYGMSYNGEWHGRRMIW